MLSPEAVSRTWEVLENYKSHIIGLGAGRVLLGATMAVREASNGVDFLKRINRELGFETMVLTGEQEAELTAAGVLTALHPRPEKALIFDLGGRSTEFVFIESETIRAVASLELGAVALTESFLTSDPPTAGEIVLARQAVRAILEKELPEAFGQATAVSLVGTAGTTTTLAAMALELSEYRRELIDNFKLGRSKLEELFVKMTRLPTTDRSALAGLARERADIIVGGAAVVLEIMNFFNADPLIVSDAGLLEGLWLAAAGLRRIYDF
jgi:exopolyphosphatase/guanosine-5'-triphosphate,3'-diphosphate pyrophosphatase